MAKANDQKHIQTKPMACPNYYRPPYDTMHPGCHTGDRVRQADVALSARDSGMYPARISPTYRLFGLTSLFPDKFQDSTFKSAITALSNNCLFIIFNHLFTSLNAMQSP
jgi:hypothetical protein